jgi:hypothetical protein
LHSFDVSFWKYARETVFVKHGVFILWMEMHVVVCSQCRNSWLFVACAWVLILGAWNDSQHGSQNLTRLNTKSKRYMWKAFIMNDHIWFW